MPTQGELQTHRGNNPFSEPRHDIYVAAKIILGLFLDGMIIATIMLVTFMLNNLALYLRLGDDKIVNPLLNIQSSVYMVIYIVFAIITIISIFKNEIKTMINT